MSPQSRALGEEPRGSLAAFPIRIFVALALVAVLYGAYAYMQHSQTVTPGRAKTAGEFNQKATPVAATGGSAVGGQAISLTPTLSVVACEPGRSAKQTLTLANNTPNELSFEVVAKDVAIRDGKAVFLPAGTALNGIAATAVFSEKYFNVKPQQTKTISIEFTVHPQTTTHGILVMLQGTDQVAFGKATMTANLGAFVAIDMKESATASLEDVGASAAAGAASFALSQWAADAASSSLPAQQATPSAGGGDSARRQDSTSGLGLGGQQP